MSHNSVTIKEGAFVLSDAHYSSLRPELLSFLEDILSAKLTPTQLIFLGDMCDTLFYEVPHTQKINQKLIDTINTLSSKIEVIYLEGNHDFNIQKIFPLVKVYPITQQPLKCSYEDKIIYLAHGDFATDIKYKIYSRFIRNTLLLRCINLLNIFTFHLIFKKLEEYLSKKEDCKDFIGFKTYIANRLEDKYRCDYFIEGHYHQNKSFKIEPFEYINLGAFACNQRYFIVKSSQEVALLEEKIFSKER